MTVGASAYLRVMTATMTINDWNFGTNHGLPFSCPDTAPPAHYVCSRRCGLRIDFPRMYKVGKRAAISTHCRSFAFGGCARAGVRACGRGRERVRARARARVLTLTFNELVRVARVSWSSPSAMVVVGNGDVRRWGRKRAIQLCQMLTSMESCPRQHICPRLAAGVRCQTSHSRSLAVVVYRSTPPISGPSLPCRRRC